LSVAAQSLAQEHKPSAGCSSLAGPAVGVCFLAFMHAHPYGDAILG
jgi:hypothetical protein